MTTPNQTIPTVCPACGRGHDAHPEFGPYCKLACLTLGMQGRITQDEPAPHFADRTQHHAS